MAKSPNETPSTLSSGRWIWSDETQSLEFMNSEAKEEVKEKKKSHTSTYQEHFRKHLEKWQKNTARPAQLDAFKTSIKRSQTSCVTLQDVKLAAVCLVQENDGLPVPLRFLSLMRSKELDGFLANLLLYFSCFFEKRALEERPKSLMAEESDSERRMTVETCVKVDLAQKQLALCYSRLLLGRGLSQQHRTPRDRIKASSTHRDMQQYECLYSFCSYAAWVTFERRDLKGIQVEVGRLFRSDTFNPALRTRLEEPGEKAKDQRSSQREDQPEVKETRQTALSDRKSHRRPALNCILSQRSPLIASLLPTPQEGAPHLFGGFRRLTLPSTAHCDTEPLMEELKQQLMALSFGILGKPLSLFSSKTLKPQSEEEAEEEEDEGDDITAPNADPRQRSLTTDKRSRVDLVSRATTEDVSSDTE